MSVIHTFITYRVAIFCKLGFLSRLGPFVSFSRGVVFGTVGESNTQLGRQREKNKLIITKEQYL